MTVSNAEAIQIGPSTKMAIAPCPQAPHATQNNIGKKHSKMTTANPVLSQTPLDLHRAPKNHGMAGKPKDRITKRVIRTSNMISARLAFSIALPTHPKCRWSFGICERLSSTAQCLCDALNCLWTMHGSWSLTRGRRFKLIRKPRSRAFVIAAYPDSGRIRRIPAIDIAT